MALHIENASEQFTLLEAPQNCLNIIQCFLCSAPLTFTTSAAQCRLWQHIGCCVLLRGVSFWSLGHD